VDKTRLLVMPIVTSDPRIKYFYHSNQSLARSRNVGLALAAGQHTTFLDSDDEYRENHLSVRIQATQKNPSWALMYGGIEYVGPAGKQYVPDAQHPTRKIHLRKCYAGGTFFARTSVLRKLRGFRNLPFASDLDLTVRMRRAGLVIGRVRTPTYRYYLDTDHRLCDLYEQGGEEAILKFRAQ
jgi:glycosyltransferase involved in cell wall biosynthesis